MSGLTYWPLLSSYNPRLRSLVFIHKVSIRFGVNGLTPSSFLNHVSAFGFDYVIDGGPVGHVFVFVAVKVASLFDPGLGSSLFDLKTLVFRGWAIDDDQMHYFLGTFEHG